MNSINLVKEQKDQLIPERMCCQFRHNNKLESKEIQKYINEFPFMITERERNNIFNDFYLKIRLNKFQEYSKSSLKDLPLFSENNYQAQFDLSFFSSITPCNNCKSYFFDNVSSEDIEMKIIQEQKDLLAKELIDLESFEEFEFDENNQPNIVKEVMKNDVVEKVSAITKPLIYSVQELIDLTKKEVMGQDDLVEKMAVIFYIHQLKIHKKFKSNKSVIPLITGSTGTGKTLIAKTMSRLIDVPFISLSMESFTPDGWVGNDIYSFLEPHIESKNFKYSIIYIDEFDKSQHGNEQQLAYNISKQHRLLTFIEGEDLSTLKKDKMSIDFDLEDGEVLTTENMQFLFSGSYRGFIINNDIGFGGSVTKSKKQNIILSKDDIVKFGIVPELAGRITSVYSTRDLTVEDYKNILTKSESGYLAYYTSIMETLGVKTSYSDDFIHSISLKACNSDYGARDLNCYLFEHFQPLITKLSKYNLADNEKISFNTSASLEKDSLTIDESVKEKKIEIKNNIC